MSAENVIKRAGLALGLVLSSCAYPLKEGELRVYNYLKFPQRASISWCVDDDVLETTQCFYQSLYWKDNRWELLIYDSTSNPRATRAPGLQQGSSHFP